MRTNSAIKKDCFSWMRELLHKQLQNLENRCALYSFCLMITNSLTEGGVDQVIKNSCEICRGALY